MGIKSIHHWTSEGEVVLRLSKSGPMGRMVEVKKDGKYIGRFLAIEVWDMLRDYLKGAQTKGNPSLERRKGQAKATVKHDLQEWLKEKG